jgi:signal transduction histidine kinase
MAWLRAVAAHGDRQRRPLLRFASSLAELVQSAATGAYDAALLDLGMPGGQGLEDVKAARLAVPQLPLIVVTADADEALGREALRFGAQDYLTDSDLGPRSLERSLRHAVDRFALQQERAGFVASFRALADAAPDPIVVHRGDTLLWANRAFAQLLGVESLEAAQVGTLSSWLDLVEPVEDGAGAATGIEPRAAVVRTRRGTVVPVELRRSRMRFAGADVTLSLVRDLAVREQYAHARAQHERLASLGRLAANLGHEINNPLSYVIANLGYLGSQLVDLGARVASDAGAEAIVGELEEARQAAADALEGAERVAAIVRDVRVLSRIESRELTSLRIPDVLQAALRIARGKLAEVAQVNVALEDVPCVRANDTALLQVFVNLLVNAADACSELPSERHEVRVGCFTDSEGRAVVEIRDTGPGLSDDIRAHLFEPFFTTKPAGSGFGLAISFAIVESLAGTLTLETDGLRGAVARVALPPAAIVMGRRGSSPRRLRPSGTGARDRAARARSAPGSAGPGAPS